MAFFTLLQLGSVKEARRTFVGRGDNQHTGIKLTLCSNVSMFIRDDSVLYDDANSLYTRVVERNET